MYQKMNFSYGTRSTNSFGGGGGGRCSACSRYECGKGRGSTHVQLCETNLIERIDLLEKDNKHLKNAVIKLLIKFKKIKKEIKAKKEFENRWKRSSW